MKSRLWVVQTARAMCGAMLLLLAAFWSVLLVRVAGGFASGGVDGARGTLHRMIMWGAGGQDPIVDLSRGYERLLVLFLVSCAFCQVYGWLNRRVRARLSRP